MQRQRKPLSESNVADSLLKLGAECNLYVMDKITERVPRLTHMLGYRTCLCSESVSEYVLGNYLNLLSINTANTSLIHWKKKNLVAALRLRQSS